MAAVCFIVPAYCAADTLGRTLRSIHRQHDRDWSAIIIDDGSDDRTSWVAANWCRRDSRMRQLRVEHGGVSRARNRGIAESDGEWLVFLDADDTVSPAYVGTMLRAARAPARDGEPVDVAACGFVRVDARGRRSARITPMALDEAALPICAMGPPGAIHSFLVRRDAVVRAGGFDETLTTNEDWDLWLRLARDGSRFAVVRGHLATYWSSAESLSRSGDQMLRDGGVVAERAARLMGEPADRVRETTLQSVFWNAGVAIGQGRSADGLAHFVPTGGTLIDAKTHLADKFIDGLSIGSGLPLARLILLWDAIMRPTDRFVAGVADRLDQADGGAAVAELIRIQLARYGRFRGIVPLGGVAAVSLNMRTLFAGLQLPSDTDSAVLRWRWLRPATVFSYLVPLCGPLTPGDMIGAMRRGVCRRIELWMSLSERGSRIRARRHRIGALARRAIGRRRREPPCFPPISALNRDAADIARRVQPQIAAAWPAAPVGSAATMHPGTGSPAAEWDAFFATEDPWNYGSPYEQEKYRRTLALLPLGPQVRALELACAEGRFTAMLAPEVGTLDAVDISAVALERARRRTAGCDNIRFATHDLFNDPIVGRYDLITCSEVLYFAPSRTALAELAARIAGALEPGGHVALAHAYELVDDRTRTAFDWDDTVGAEGIRATFAAHPEFRHVAAIDTDLYRIDLFQRGEAGDAVETPVVQALPIDAPIEPRVAGGIVWGGAVRTRGELASQRSYHLPLFRLPGSGDEAALTANLRFLRRRGYQSVSLDDLVAGAARAGSFRGRPLLLWSDDADRDAVDRVHDLVRSNGFDLHLFVRANDGLDADWLRARMADGLGVGSALVSGHAADALPTAALLEEGVAARLTLQQITGAPVRSVAPAYGLSDTRVEQILVAAGYQRLFTRRRGVAAVCGDEMMLPTLALPRPSLDELQACLPAGIEPPDAADRS